MSNFEVASFVRDQLLSDTCVSEVALNLTQHCFSRHSSDNITTIIISFLNKEKRKYLHTEKPIMRKPTRPDHPNLRLDPGPSSVPMVTLKDLHRFERASAPLRAKGTETDPGTRRQRAQTGPSRVVPGPARVVSRSNSTKQPSARPDSTRAQEIPDPKKTRRPCTE